MQTREYEKALQALKEEEEESSLYNHTIYQRTQQVEQALDR